MKFLRKHSWILLVTALICAGTSGVVLAYASLTAWQWRLWQSARHALRHGSESAADLTWYLTDRRAAWTLGDHEDVIGLADAGTLSEIQAADAKCFGLLAWDLPGWWRYGDPLLVAALSFSFGLVVTMGACGGAIFSLRHAGSPLAAARVVASRPSLGRAMVRSIGLSAAFLPLVGALAWYLDFDRSGDRRCIFAAFSPTGHGWISAGLASLVSGFVIARALVGMAAGRLDPGDSASPHAVCARCRYPTVGLPGRTCPECGTLGGAAIPLVGGRGATMVVIGAILTVVGFGAGLRATGREWWLTAAWRWATLRSHFIPNRIEGFLPLGQAVEIAWADGTAWIVVATSAHYPPGPNGDAPTGFAWVWRSSDGVEHSECGVTDGLMRIQLGAHALVAGPGMYWYGDPVVQFKIGEPPIAFRVGNTTRDSGGVRSVFARLHETLTPEGAGAHKGVP
jgi:hypothetical protein